MPRNKVQQDSNEKRAEILDAARKLFMEVGYDATSMAAIATSAGVSANTIYWYFKDKDELLIAVLDTELEQGLTALRPGAAADPLGRLLMVVNQLQQASHLVATVHARMLKSSSINAWHERFHRLSEDLILAELRQAGIPPKKAKALMKIWIFTIEGLLAHPMTDAEKREICSVLVSEAAAHGNLVARTFGRRL
ncbi:TetR/AcrR family transcriptional regulator [Hydrocarboniphaga effusa]|uniref:TetR/AcrR family transcriptional regulator n=1 Tax=Hydrocarboniphaga effusa TaxID=243629 RepID=UPI00398BED0F